MTWLRILLHRLRGVFLKAGLDRELGEEIRIHLEMQIDENIRQGMAPEQARLAALRQFGGIEQVKETYRDRRGLPLIETSLQDIHYAFRTLRAAPMFTIAALATLALGIGANTAIFSVVNGLLLKPLPYPDSDRLVWISEMSPDQQNQPVTGAHFLEWQESSSTLEQIAAYNDGNATLTGAGEPERLDCGMVSADFFRLLGVQPLLGRDFLESEDRPDGGTVAILSHDLWRRRFNADPDVIGRSIALDDHSYTIVGVLPRSFHFFQPIELWLPLALNPAQERGNEQISILNAIARLKSGVTRDQAQAELETIRSTFEAQKPAQVPLMSGEVRLAGLHTHLVGDTRQLLLILLGAVATILLIACANVANLQLSRGAARQREFAIRAALGAGRLRLVRQMLTESLLLSVSGGVAGLLLGYWLAGALVALAAGDTFGEISRLGMIGIDVPVLIFTFLVSVATGLLFGLAPAVQLSRPDLNDALKAGGSGSRLHRGRLRHLLTVGELALAILLVVGAGLLIRSFVTLLRVDPGYQPEKLITMRLSLPPRYERPNRRAALDFYRDILGRLSAMPGVDSVGGINHLPLMNFGLGGWLRVPGRPPAASNNAPPTPIGIVTENYFRAMGIPLVAGRIFSERDNAEAPRVIILSASLARQLFPDEDPLGKEVWVPGPGKETPKVVGIVGDIRHKGLDQAVTPQVYVPYQQNPSGTMAFAIRSAGDPGVILKQAREQVWEIDGELPVYDAETMEQRLAASITPHRFSLTLLSTFALLSLVLAAVGVYGVIAYAVARRTHEIGIRMALGAGRRDVLRLLVGQGMRLVTVGILAGLGGAWGLTRLMKSLLFNVSATDPMTFAGAAALLVVVALLACYVPARRATRLDPLTALRHE